MKTSAIIFYHEQPILNSLNILKIILQPSNFCPQVCHLSTAIENCLLIRFGLSQNISIHACCSFSLDSDFKLMQYLTWHAHNHGSWQSWFWAWPSFKYPRTVLPRVSQTLKPLNHFVGNHVDTWKMLSHLNFLVSFCASSSHMIIWGINRTKNKAATPLFPKKGRWRLGSCASA